MEWMNNRVLCTVFKSGVAYWVQSGCCVVVRDESGAERVLNAKFCRRK